jgi:hypothetical protein
LSIDPNVSATDQPYAFTNDDPLNMADPLGLEEEGEGCSLAGFGGPQGAPETGGGIPTVERSGDSGAADVSSATSIRDNLLKLDDGNRSPNKSVGSQSDLRKFFAENIKGGKIEFQGGVSGGGMVRYLLPDGTTVQYRGFSDFGGDTVDITFPNDPQVVKVHIKP